MKKIEKLNSELIDYSFSIIDFSKKIHNKVEIESLINFAFASVQNFFSEKELLELDLREVLEKDYFLILNSLQNELNQEIDSSNYFKNLENTFLKRAISEKNQILSILSARFYLINNYLAICNYRNIKNPYQNSYDFIQARIKNKIYISNLEDLPKSLFQESLVQYDLLYDYAGLKKYEKYTLFKDLENRELLQEIFVILAYLLNPEKNNKQVQIEILNNIREKKISLATPILCNLRYTGFSSAASCYITQMDDSVEKIFETMGHIAQISKDRGGVGVDISYIRSKGSRVKNIENVSTGIVPVCKLIDSTGLAINQSGKRPSAITVNLPIWHLDLFDFLSLQLQYGDHRQKAMDIFPQVGVNDAFMERLVHKKDWTLFNPYEIKDKFNINLNELFCEEFTEAYDYCIKNKESLKHLTLPASEIMKKILISQLETGLPYFIFTDTINRKNQNKDHGSIPNVNLCVESFSNFGTLTKKKNNLETNPIHVCNLVSINLSNIFTEDEIQSVTSVSVKILNGLIDLTNSNIKGVNLHNELFRVIGIGILGFHDYLSWKKIRYGSKDSLEQTFRVVDSFLLGGISESINQSRLNKKYSLYNGSEWSKGLFNSIEFSQIHKTEINGKIIISNYEKKWAQVIIDLKKYGIRNSQIFAIAPNGASAIFQSATPSILPTYNNFYLTDTSETPSPVFTKFFTTRGNYYDKYSDLDFDAILDLVEILAKRIDQGISFEPLYDLNKDINAKLIVNRIVTMWKKEFKTIYYFRTIQKNQKLSEKEECESCSA